MSTRGKLKQLDKEMNPTTFGEIPLSEKIAKEIKQRAKIMEQGQEVKK